MKLEMREFKVNKYLTLTLEDGKTNIHVNGELFNQCKYLAFQISPQDAENFDNRDEYTKSCVHAVFSYTEKVRGIIFF